MPERKHPSHRSKTGWPVWAAAIATLLFGLALLIWPALLTDLILNIAGAALIIVGAFNVLRYFLQKDPYDGINWNLCLGLMLLISGVILIAFKHMLLSIVPLLFGLALLLGGIVKLQAAFNMRRMAYARWYFTMIPAAISCALGLLIILAPFGTGLILIRVIGAALAVESVQDLISLLSYKKVTTTYFTR